MRLALFIAVALIIVAVAYFSGTPLLVFIADLLHAIVAICNEIAMQLQLLIVAL